MTPDNLPDPTPSDEVDMPTIDFSNGLLIGEVCFTKDGRMELVKPAMSDPQGFSPRHRSETPSVVVTPADDQNHPPMPLGYFMDGFLRHHEKLTGMAGNIAKQEDKP